MNKGQLFWIYGNGYTVRKRTVGFFNRYDQFAIFQNGRNVSGWVYDTGYQAESRRLNLSGGRAPTASELFAD